MGEALTTNAALTVLDLSYNCLQPRGATALAAGLKANATLQRLLLAHNGVGDVGAAALLDACKANTRLAELDLGANNIGVAGMTAIGAALKANPGALKRLDLRSGRPNAEGGCGGGGPVTINPCLSIGWPGAQPQRSAPGGRAAAP